MREYLLYLKEEARSIQAYVSPCFEVDLMYWRDREGCKLHIMGKSTSLALIFSLREIMNSYFQVSYGRDKRINDQELEKIKQMILEYVREVSHLYRRGAAGKESLRDEWFMWEMSDSNDFADAHLTGKKVQAMNDDKENLSSSAKAHRVAFAGRSLLWEEVETLRQKRGLDDHDSTAALQRMVLAEQAEWQPGIRLSVKKSWWRNHLELSCERCGSGRDDLELTVCHSCGQGCAYCTVCLGMGRSKCCTPYLLVPAQSGVSSVKKAKGRVRDVSRLQWKGSYSKDQATAAELARRFVASPRPGLDEFLIWAVCGAGKTELLFPSIAEALSAGGRVLIATPRKDVVLELAPRIQKVFPNAQVIAVHGSSAQKWEDSDITIATTHQVMRYYRRFPLVVLDEADAFPYHNNLVLYRAVARAVQAGGKMLYLSATPPRYLQKRLILSKGRLFTHSSGIPLSSASHVLLPGRYHGSALPVPEVITVQGLHKHVQSNRPVAPLIEMVRGSLDNGRQVFLFVPRIDDVEKVLVYIQKQIPAHASQMAGVHAADSSREEKVMAFRERRFTLMVTTTILERGVTIPRSDVVVLGAEAPVFDEASLVQIAGRVGRSFDDTTGTVLFLQADRASSPRAAVKQICRMNQLTDKLRAQEART
ncbi:DEAD/DEAH box helicase [Brevibacillus reuszeri]|uniref:DEAD/DEAH box helicase n=1 Tax=Brevibacillus reuszeri TaxID=54915 RepID=UPI0028996DA9|nr:helicase-related protein [Brevibacillus reuszeri]